MERITRLRRGSAEGWRIGIPLLRSRARCRTWFDVSTVISHVRPHLRLRCWDPLVWFVHEEWQEYAGHTGA